MLSAFYQKKLKHGEVWIQLISQELQSLDSNPRHSASSSERLTVDLDHYEKVAIIHGQVNSLGIFWEIPSNLHRNSDIKRMIKQRQVLHKNVSWAIPEDLEISDVVPFQIISTENLWEMWYLNMATKKSHCENRFDLPCSSTIPLTP